MSQRSRGFLRYEHRNEPVAARHVFLGRLAQSILTAAVLIGASLAVGMAGYAFFGDMGGVDAFENTAMILSGMGPLAQMPSSAGRIFAGLYALYSGLVLILTTGIVLAPVAHQVLHHFHVAGEP